MPTGYTQDLADGKDVTFEQFAMKCARAFGALIEMRDEPLDAKVPQKFTTPPYYSERLERARARVTEVNSWTQQQAAAEADKAHAEAVEYREQMNRESRDRRARYMAMLKQVQAWRPPTPDHEGLKEFMGKQLMDSVRYECHEEPVPVPVSWRDYMRTELATAKRNLQYAEEAMAEEIKRTQGRAAWLDALRESLA